MEFLLFTLPTANINHWEKKNIYLQSFYINKFVYIVMLPATPFNLSDLIFFVIDMIS